MPDAKDNAKASGDVHPPDVEDMDARSSPAGAPQAEDTEDGTPGRERQDGSRAGKVGSDKS